MATPQLAFGTPRKLPSARSLVGRVVVLDIAFAGPGKGGGFDRITLPVIDGLGERLAAWVDHHDHEEHGRYAADARFVLTTKAEHGACPELVTPELVARVGAVDTVLCHNDFDGLASAAKWIRGGVEPYAGCDDDARAIDTRMGQPSATGVRFDRALRGKPNDPGLWGLVVRHLVTGLTDKSLWVPIDEAAAALGPIEEASEELARQYRCYAKGVAVVDATNSSRRYDKTWLLLLGQQREAVSVVLDRDNVSLAARFDSGWNFLELLGLAGGMPTRVSVPRSDQARVFDLLGIPEAKEDFR